MRNLPDETDRPKAISKTHQKYLDELNSVLELIHHEFKSLECDGWQDFVPNQKLRTALFSAASKAETISLSKRLGINGYKRID